jgi:large subunit ribosomal protein L31
LRRAAAELKPRRENALRTDIHPNYDLTTVTCSCGNSFETKSTKPGDMHIELCNECHPFFTGKQKVVDAGGRVERFQRRYGKSTFTKAGEAEDADADTDAEAEASDSE